MYFNEVEDRAVRLCVYTIVYLSKGCCRRSLRGLVDADSEVEDNGGVDSVDMLLSLLSLLSLSVVCSPLYDPAIRCQCIRLL